MQPAGNEQARKAIRISSKQHQAVTRTASRRQVAAGGQGAGSKAPRLVPWVEGVSTATTLCCSFLPPSVEETARRSQSSKPPPAASVLSLQVCQAACQTKRRSENLRNTSQTGPPTHYVCKLATDTPLSFHLRSGVAESSDSDRKTRTRSQVACNNFRKPVKRRSACAGRLRVPAREASLAGCGRPHLPPSNNTAGARENTRERSADFE